MTAQLAPTPSQTNLRTFGAPIGLAFLIAAVLTIGAAIPQQLARQYGWFGQYWFEGAGAISRLAIAGIVLVVVRHLGWLQLAGVRGRTPGAFTRAKDSWPMVVAATLPAIGLFTTSWQATESIAMWVVYIAATVAYETIIFRGLLFAFLAKQWEDQENGVMWAAVVSSLLFGLAHIHPVAILMAAATSLALTRLQFDAGVIWIGMILHLAYDVFSHLPVNEAGETLGSMGSVFALPFVAVAAVSGVIHLRRSDQTLANQTRAVSIGAQ